MYPTAPLPALPLIAGSRGSSSGSLPRRPPQSLVHGPSSSETQGPHINSSQQFSMQYTPDQSFASPSSGQSTRRAQARPNRKTPEQTRYWNTVLSTNSSPSMHVPPPPPPIHHASSVCNSGDHNNSSMPDRSQVKSGHRQTAAGSSSQVHGAEPGMHLRSRSSSERLDFGAPFDSQKKKKTANTPLQCPECPQMFEKRPELMTHMQNAHNPERTYPCKYAGCQKVFGHRSSRSRHEKTHRISMKE